MPIDPDVLEGLGDMDYEAPSRSDKSPALLFGLHVFGPGDVRLSITEDRPKRPKAKFYHLFRSQWDVDAYVVREAGQEQIYTVHPQTPHCDCKGFEFSHHCRHIAGLLDLEERGETWQIPSTEVQNANRNEESH